jgi:hypothetical protein
MSVQAIAVTLSHVRFGPLPFVTLCRTARVFSRVFEQAFLPNIEAASVREVQLGMVHSASLMQHLHTSSLILLPHRRAPVLLQQIVEDSFAFWALMNDVSRHLQRRGVALQRRRQLHWGGTVLLEVVQVAFLLLL